ncbi:MAG: hypothetical protein WC114_05220, partial [Smithellaceae bacterium]
MALLRNSYRFLRQAFSLRIWLTSLIVILLILLLALTVNNAREKEMADLFSRQQLASAQNASARMTEILSQVERNVALFSYFDPNGKILSPKDHREIEILYSVWGKTIDAVLVFDAREGVRRVLSQEALPRVNLIPHFRILKNQKRQYLSLALSDVRAGGAPASRQDWYLIWGNPIWRDRNIFDGAWMVSFSLAALVHAGERQIQENRLGDLWLIDDRGRIVLHPNSPYIGKNTGDLVRDSRGNAITLSPA